MRGAPLASSMKRPHPQSHWALIETRLGTDFGVRRIEGESEPSNIATEKTGASAFILASNPSSPVRFRKPIFPKPRGIAGFSRSNLACVWEVSASRD